MSEWNEPRPEQLITTSRDRHVSIYPKSHPLSTSYDGKMVYTPTHIGAWKPEELPENERKLLQSKVIAPHYAIRNCKKCGSPMQVVARKVNGEMVRGYRCLSGKGCQDARAKKYTEKQHEKYRLLAKIPKDRHIKGVPLNPDWIKAC